MTVVSEFQIFRAVYQELRACFWMDADYRELVMFTGRKSHLIVISLEPGIFRVRHPRILGRTCAEYDYVQPDLVERLYSHTRSVLEAGGGMEYFRAPLGAPPGDEAPAFAPGRTGDRAIAGDEASRGGGDRSRVRAWPTRRPGVVSSPAAGPTEMGS